MRHRCINVVVTCTARKTVFVPKALRLRGIAANSVDERFGRWVKSLETNEGETKQAIKMYCGGAWSIIRKLADDRQLGPRLRIWIISAGQGLVHPASDVCPYSATFSPGHADSISDKNGDCTAGCRWWQLLINWRRDKGAEISSIEDIARRFPGDPLIVTLSRDYFSAVNTDLKRALQHLRKKDQLVVICAGANKQGEFAENLLPCDARFENLFKCCRTDINANLLAAIVRRYGVSEISANVLRGDFESQMAQLPRAAHPKRMRSDDSNVCNFITKRLKKDPTTTHTNCLRAFRLSGSACEQSRFRRLFKSVRKKMYDKLS